MIFIQRIPNLFDLHPPFQIDGNFGGAAGVIEMLMQPTSDKIKLLLALLEAWPDGSVKGICARGGIELAFNWKNGNVSKVKIYSTEGGKTTVLCQGKGS